MQKINQAAKGGYDTMIQKGFKPAEAKKSAETFIKKQRIVQGLTAPSTEYSNNIPEKHSEDSAPIEMVKSVYNGLVPSLLKTPTALASLFTNAAGVHSQTIDDIDKGVDEWVDKNASAYIDPEHNQGIFKTDEKGNREFQFTNARSVLNGFGYGVGMVGQFVALAYLTGGAGDVAEAAEAVKVATAAGDELGLAKATQLYKAASSKLVMTKAASGSLLFTPQIYKEAQHAGLNPADAARLSLVLGTVLGGIGAIGPEAGQLEKYLAGEMPGAEGAVVNEFSEKGLLEGLKGRVKGQALSEADFATTVKATTKSFSQLAKKLVNGQTAKIAGKEFGQMYMQSAVQKFGEQMYDNMYGDGKEVGKGKFGAKEIVDENDPSGAGPSLFGYKVNKNSFIDDTQNGIYGAMIGMGMGMFNTPMVNQSLYGYLDGKIRGGKAQEGVGKVHKMADILLKQGKMTAEQHAELVGTPAVEGKPAAEGQPEVQAQPAKKGLIDKMAETSATLKDINGDKVTAEASYDVYNYQNNEKPKIEKDIHDFSHPANPDPQAKDNGGLVEQLRSLKQTDPNNTPAISALQARVADGYDAWTNNIEKHTEINKHITETTATGKFKDIRQKLNEISGQKHDYKTNADIAPLMEGFDREARAKAKEGKTPDGNGVRYKDLVGESVTHSQLGKGTIAERDNSLPGEEPQKEHYFQPEDGTKHTEIVDGNEAVDNSKYSHNLKAPKEDTEKSSATENPAPIAQEEPPEARQVSPEEQLQKDVTETHDKYTPEQKESLTKSIEEDIPEIEKDEVLSDALSDLADDLDAIAAKNSPKENPESKKDKGTEIQQLTAAEPETFSQLVMQYFIGINKNFKHFGKLEDTEQIRKDTGYTKQKNIRGEVEDPAEFRNRRWLFHSTKDTETKVTKTLDQLAGDLKRQWEDSGHDPIDQNEAQNIILDVTHSHEKQSSMVAGLKEDFSDSNGNIIKSIPERAEAKVQDEHNREGERKAKWEAEHPEEVAEKKVGEAKKELDNLATSKETEDENCPF
jgi:hypothetical protein